MRKKILAVMIALVCLLAGSTGVLLMASSKKKSQSSQSQMTREGTVRKGNLDLSVSASGTTTGGTLYDLYDLDLTGESETGSLKVESVQVKVGDSVKKGDTLLTLTKDSVENTKEILKNAVENYQLEWIQAKADYQTAVNDAKEEYATNVSLGTTSKTDYEDTVENYNKTVAKKKKALEQAKKIIAEYPNKIGQYKKNLEKEEARQKKQNKIYEKALSQKEKDSQKVKAGKTAYSKAKEEYETIKKVWDYLIEYEKKYQDSKVDSMKTVVKKQLQEKKENMAKKKSAYEKALQKESKQEKLVQKRKQEKDKTAQTISSRKQTIASYQSKLKDAKANYFTYQAEYYTALSEKESGKVTAQEAYAANMTTYTNAKTIYDSAIKTAKTDLKTAKNNYTKAKKRQKAFYKLVKNGKIAAGHSGNVAAFTYEKGNVLSKTTPLAAYVDTGIMNITASIDQTEISNIHVGDTVNVSLENNPETKTGKVAAIEMESSSDSASTVTYSVTVSVDNTKGTLSTEETASLSFSKGTIDNVLLVPESAISQKKEEYYVTVKNSKGKTQKKKVTVGESNGQFTQIKSGLKEGETYVIQWQE